MLVQPINLLILDEPTNHLDIQSRETLLAALQNFSGTVVLVSHDRHFLRLLINRVFEIDHGEMRIYDGHYEYYLEKSGREHRAACCGDGRRGTDKFCVIQYPSGRRYLSRILKTNAELLAAVNNGGEFVAQFGGGEFLVGNWSYRKLSIND